LSLTELEEHQEQWVTICDEAQEDTWGGQLVLFKQKVQEAAASPSNSGRIDIEAGCKL
jgi:hypothetical protein